MVKLRDEVDRKKELMAVGGEMSGEGIMPRLVESMPAAVFWLT